MQCYLNFVQVIFLIKVVCQPCSNIAQVNDLCNVVQKAPDNIAQEKILFNVVSTLLTQHSIGKNLVQCYRRGSRQHCTGKLLFNVALVLLGQHCTGKNPCAMLPKRLQITLHRKPSAFLSKQHHFSAIFILDQLIF